MTWYYTEFYCNASTGSNLNGGSSSGSPSGTDAGATYGRDTGAAGVDRITASSGTPFSSCQVGEYVGVKAAGGASPADFVARVTAINSGGASIDVNDTWAAGTRPAHSASVDVKVGGAWKGPNGTENFPFGFVADTLVGYTSGTFYPYRINFKNNANYSVTAAVNSSTGLNAVFQGYTSTPGDGGKFVIDGSGITGTSVNLIYMNLSSSCQVLRDAILQNNGDTGSAAGFSVAGTSQQPLIERVIVQNVRGTGIYAMSGRYHGCAATGCNQSNTATRAGFELSGGAAVTNCVSYANTTSNTRGFLLQANTNQIGCIAWGNGNAGFENNGANMTWTMIGCDAYDNGGAGFTFSPWSYFGNITCINCNAVANTGWGFDKSNFQGFAQFYNCGVGGGAYVNSSGGISYTDAKSETIEVGTVNYITHPWADPDNGDFRITSAQSKGQGYGSGFGGISAVASTIAYPDIGAAQHQDAGGGLLFPSGLTGGFHRG